MTSAAAPPLAPVTLASIKDAARALAGIAERTPMVEAPALSRAAGVAVWLKCEHLQPVGAFKLRGAYTAISRLPEAVRARGVVTHSSGNHGAAVAWAARRLGIRAVVVMPEDAPRVKIDNVRRFGGEIVFVTDRSQREPTADRIAREQGLVAIPPYEYADVIAGQGTCGLEIVEQCPAVGTVLVPVGGGGLLAGIATAVKAIKNTVSVVGVEPEGAAKLSAALAAGGPSRLEKTTSLADGLLPLALGQLPWRQIAGVVTTAVTVRDADLEAAVRFLYQQMGLRVEPSGAATVAALLGDRYRPQSPTVAVLSGGNVDGELFERLVHG
jgi:threonine dehydratase